MKFVEWCGLILRGPSSYPRHCYRGGKLHIIPGVPQCSLLHVCRDARAPAMQVQSPFFEDCQGAPTIFYNSALDTLQLLRPEDETTTLLDVFFRILTRIGSGTLPEGDRIPKLTVLWEHWDEVANERIKDVMDDLSVNGVRELTLVAGGEEASISTDILFTKPRDHPLRCITNRVP